MRGGNVGIESSQRLLGPFTQKFRCSGDSLSSVLASLCLRTSGGEAQLAAKHRIVEPRERPGLETDFGETGFHMGTGGMVMDETARKSIKGKDGMSFKELQPLIVCSSTINLKRRL